MNPNFVDVSSNKPPSEEPVQPEAPNQKDSVTSAVIPEISDPEMPFEEPDPFDDGNFPV